MRLSDKKNGVETFIEKNEEKRIPKQATIKQQKRKKKPSFSVGAGCLYSPCSGAQNCNKVRFMRKFRAGPHLVSVCKAETCESGLFSETAHSVMKGRDAKSGLAHGKTDNGVVKAVRNGGKIQLSVFTLHFRNVGQPFGVGLGCLESALNQTFAELVGWISFRDAVRPFTTLE